VLVRDEEPAGSGRVGQTVWVRDRAHFREGLERLDIDDGHLVIARDRREDAPYLRHCPDSVNAGEAVQVGHDLSRPGVEDDELVGVHVGDVEPAACRIEALIVEANSLARHRDVGDEAQRRRPRVRGGGDAVGQDQQRHDGFQSPHS
jgi:hypothetical protein